MPYWRAPREGVADRRTSRSGDHHLTPACGFPPRYPKGMVQRAGPFTASCFCRSLHKRLVPRDARRRWWTAQWRLARQVRAEGEIVQTFN